MKVFAFFLALAFAFDQYIPAFSSSYQMAAVSELGDSLEFDDGSIWGISIYDGYKARLWRLDDSLLVTQNTRWFSSYTYRIVNRNTGTSVEANFSGPIRRNERTRSIAEINVDQRAVQLSDKTHWEIPFSDSSIIRDWAIGDPIIIGSNSGWDSTSESILINAAMNNFSRAHQY